MTRSRSILTTIAILAVLVSRVWAGGYPIVDTGQRRCYDDRREIAYPKAGAAFFGQDAQYGGNTPAYNDNGDGTVSDRVTGLMWEKDPGAKKTCAQAEAGAARCRTGGHKDWRLPTIKELYSLILFSGTDPDPRGGSDGQKPFIDTRFFKFNYGRSGDGDRIIDSQYASATRYVSTTMGGNKTMFGVNFADGRIKGYPAGATRGGRVKKYYVLYVRGNAAYGKNDFVDNKDGTITDRATGLTWMKVDSGKLKAGRKRDGKLNWSEALAWAGTLRYADHSDWRLPNAKELQSIVDYARSPDTTSSAAIDPIFRVTPIVNEGGKKDYPQYWTSTTHARGHGGAAAAYLCFGRGLGFMSRRGSRGSKTLMDVHGAGAQRSDPKNGDPSRLSTGRGPQGDVVRIYNFVRCVRGGKAEPRTTGPKVEKEAPSRGDEFVRRHDRDGDGKVSRREFPGPDEHFRRFDRNRDGYLTTDETPEGPPPRRGAPANPPPAGRPK